MLHVYSNVARDGHSGEWACVDPEIFEKSSQRCPNLERVRVLGDALDANLPGETLLERLDCFVISVKAQI